MRVHPQKKKKWIGKEIDEDEEEEKNVWKIRLRTKDKW